jgi:hypothetical protein
MAMAVASDTEHFVNCGVCFCEFDEETRKPKFLQCAHTVCLKCLKVIMQSVTTFILNPWNFFTITENMASWRDYVPFLPQNVLQ